MKWIIGMVGIIMMMGCHPKVGENKDGNKQVFGDGLHGTKRMSFAQVEKRLEKSDTIEARVSGIVNEVCQMKGCWMTLDADITGGSQITVRFKDYGFFVPKDISGEKVVIEGKVYKELTSVEDLKHYAIDAGLPENEIEKIDKPRIDYVFLASGVELYRN